MADIKYEIRQHEEWTVFVLEGRLDMSNAKDVGDKMNELLQQSSKLAVEISGLEYLSSAGIRILMRTGKQCKAAGKAYALCGAMGFVKEVIEDANMDVLVEMYADSEALP